MKKYIMLLLILGLTGCGANRTESNVLYDLEDISPQSSLFRSYNDALQNDAEKTIADMDEITNEIFAEGGEGCRVYRDKEHPELMVYYNERRKNTDKKGYGLAYEVLFTAKEHRDLINDFEKKTGLIYSGSVLGREYPGNDDADRDHYTDEGFTGKNLLTFSNPAYDLVSFDPSLKFGLPVYDRLYPDDEDYMNIQYKDLPLRVNLYMDNEKIKYINIFFLTNEKTKTLTEKNLKELSFDPTAAELMNSLYSQNRDTKGTKNGVKYMLCHNVTQTAKNMQLNVLSLEY